MRCKETADPSTNTLEHETGTHKQIVVVQMGDESHITSFNPMPTEVLGGLDDLQMKLETYSDRSSEFTRTDKEPL